MKFFRSKNIFYHNNINFFENTCSENNSFFYNNFYDYEKNLVKNRKFFYKIKPGVSLNIKKNSIKRNSNSLLFQQYINLNTKKGNKNIFFLNFNKSVENLLYVFKYNIEDLNSYVNYSNFIDTFNKTFKYQNTNQLIEKIVDELKSVFEIKTKKNNKKIKTLSKYSHEIIYIPRQRRLKYVLRSLSLYKEYFNNYCLWERIF